MQTISLILRKSLHTLASWPFYLWRTSFVFALLFVLLFPVYIFKITDHALTNNDLPVYISLVLSAVAVLLLTIMIQWWIQVLHPYWSWLLSIIALITLCSLDSVLLMRLAELSLPLWIFTCCMCVLLFLTALSSYVAPKKKIVAHASKVPDMIISYN